MKKYAILLTLAACGQPHKKVEAPTQLAAHQPSPPLPGLEHGLCQSPINIVTSRVDGGTHSVSMRYFASQEKVVNKGHTIEVDFDPGSYLEFDGSIYDLKQFHFHTPSEHLIDSKSYPMEMHIVHIRRETQAGGPPHYLVIGSMFNEENESAFLNKFLSDVPKTAHASNVPLHKVVELTDLFPDGLQKYYSYKGSLTTPPYSETVSWLVLKNEFDASSKQISTIRNLEGENARRIQAPAGRTVEEN